MTKEIMITNLTIDVLRLLFNEKMKIEKKKFNRALDFISCGYCERSSNGE